MKLLLTMIVFISTFSQNANAFTASCSVGFEDSLITALTRGEGRFGGGQPTSQRQIPNEFEAYFGLIHFHEIVCETKNGNTFSGEVFSAGAGLYFGSGNFSLSCPFQSEVRAMDRIKKGKKTKMYIAEASASAAILGGKAGIGVGRLGSPCFVGNLEIISKDEDGEIALTGAGAEAGVHVITFDDVY